MKFFYVSILLWGMSFLGELSAQVDTSQFMATNLVPNPGFEDLRRALPPNDLDGSLAFRNSIAKWASPTKATPDLHFFDYVEAAGEDAPRSGNAVAAILTHNPRSKRSHTYREYIQTKLEKTLTKGQEYYFEVWVKRASNAQMASNNIGVIVRPDPIIRQEWRPILHVRPVVEQRQIINRYKREWIKVSGTFKAAGGERFLIIGNFHNNQTTKLVDASDLGKQSFRQSYYLLDDVGLYQSKTLPPPEPEPVSEVETLENMVVRVGQTIQLDRIYFETAKWRLLSASFEELNQLVGLMAKRPGMKIAIHGHTDDRGSDVYNQQLSENRAKAVHQYLLEHGIPQERIGFEGFGESTPIASNDTAEGRQLNRRVEFTVLEFREEEGLKMENIATDGH
ncbi:MAG: OmpA family protein [Bacteroidota bacterium]